MILMKWYKNPKEHSNSTVQSNTLPLPGNWLWGASITSLVLSSVKSVNSTDHLWGLLSSNKAVNDPRCKRNVVSVSNCVFPPTPVFRITKILPFRHLLKRLLCQFYSWEHLSRGILKLLCVLSWGTFLVQTVKLPAILRAAAYTGYAMRPT